MCNEDVDASSYHPRAAAKLSAPLPRPKTGGRRESFGVEYFELADFRVFRLSENI